MLISVWLMMDDAYDDIDDTADGADDVDVAYDR